MQNKILNFLPFIFQREKEEFKPMWTNCKNAGDLLFKIHSRPRGVFSLSTSATSSRSERRLDNAGNIRKVERQFIGEGEIF
jgi:hypothetical protein